MGIHTDRGWRSDLIFYSLILMLAGVFTSRVLLSSATIVFCLFSCVHTRFPDQWRRFWRTPVLMAVALLFFLPLVTWFWSENRETWWRFIRIKLPLFLLPLAFAGSWRISRQRWRGLAVLFIVLTVAGSCWSLWQYLQDSQAMHSGYLRAKVIPTPFENDHVRYSLAVCLAILCASFLFAVWKEKLRRLLLAMVMLFLVVYLHVLSARTGLLSLYLVVLFGLIRVAVSVRKTKWVITLASLAVLMPMLSWFLLPTFQNRIRYVVYDLTNLRERTYLPGASDGNRRWSLEAGWSILKAHPGGVGYGDVIDKTYDWYALHIPQMAKNDRLYPSSEWLMYGAAAGWVGVMGFCLSMLVPFSYRPRASFYWQALCGILALSLVFDIGLEVQFGVFIHAFLLLWWWKWSGEEDSVENGFAPNL